MPFRNLKEIEEKEIIPGYRARFIHSQNMTLAYWDIDKEAPLPEHSHPHEQAANILEGRFELKIGNESRILEPGDVAVIPPNIKHSGKAITRCRILDVFYPVREDYL
ncbi:cupin domain-containing protein [Candidatus Woesearchaeota archaeon]|nr:cupin domain-containing protein [Candidatus Woesearchaeota archaeon]